MRRLLLILMLASAVPQLGCAGCAGFGKDPGDGQQTPNSEHPGYDGATPDDTGRFDVGDDTGGDDAALGDDGPDLGFGADAGRDAAHQDLQPGDVCGDGMVGGAEVCDDGNTVDGDYCSSTCDAETGTCGDGVLQAGESCDDGSTSDCVTTHDGGDGSCLPAGSCAAGYVLDGAACTPNNTTGLSVPCQNGAGFTLFRYHYSNNSTSAQIDVWDANCSYSFAPNSACNVYEICPGFCDPDVTSDGYPIFDGSDYMRVRFDVNGLSFSQATFYVQARSYATSSSAQFRLWSPLYGETYGGPVDNDFVYDWYGVDWTGFLYPNDDPGYTAIQLYGSSGRVAVKAVELCVE